WCQARVRPCLESVATSSRRHAWPRRLRDTSVTGPGPGRGSFGLELQRSLDPRAADDDAVQTELAHGFDVAGVADAACREQAPGEARPRLAQQLEIGSRTRAVAVDRRADHRLDARVGAA